MYQKISKLALGAATALAMLAGAANAAEWRGWNIHVDGYPNTIAMDRFADLLAEKTNGEMTLKMFHGGTLGSQPDAIEQVRLGGLQIMAAKGITVLAWFDAGARSFYNAKDKSIGTPDDVSGMKVRVMNNDLYSGMIAEMGGNPSPMAFAEVYQALKTGVVDGAENNWPSYESTGHYEVINTDVYNGLSEEMQAAVKQAAVEAAAVQRYLWGEREAASRAKVVEAGVTVNEVADKAPFQAAMKPVYDNYLASNPDLKPLVELIQSTE